MGTLDGMTVLVGIVLVLFGSMFVFGFRKFPVMSSTGLKFANAGSSVAKLTSIVLGLFFVVFGLLTLAGQVHVTN
jgi:hypothetical protein